MDSEQTYFRNNGSQFNEQLLKFSEFGTNTVLSQTVFAGEEVPVFTNEFWTSKQRAGCAIHEISYRACFKPQLPRFFIERLTKEGEAVYDPFMGRGTTLVESALLGRKIIGNDINPLSRILVEPRLAVPSLKQVEARLSELDLDHPVKIDKELLAFYHPLTLRKITNLRSYFLNATQLDGTDRWIRMVATNRLTGHSSGFFSVYTMPPNQAVSVASQMKINEKRNQIPPERDVIAIILKKSKSLLSRISMEEKERLRGSEVLDLLTGKASRTDEIPSSSVKLIVTSPPFLDVVDYQKDNWLRCWFNGIDSRAVPVSQLRKPDDWTKAMIDVFKELKRVLSSDGHIAFEVGEVRGGKLKMEELVIPAAMSVGLKPLCVMVNAQHFTKTSNCWGVANDVKGTNTNRIVILSH